MTDLPTRPRAVVLGVGNTLLSDDGFGPAVIAHLEAHFQLGPDVELVDVGTAGMDLGVYLLDREAVIFLDTVDDPASPGSLVELDAPTISGSSSRGPRLSPHQPGIGDALALARFAERAPKLIALIGLVPTTIAVGVELSAEARAQCEPAAKRVVNTLTDWGFCGAFDA